jgi:hypothetical protein
MLFYLYGLVTLDDDLVLVDELTLCTPRFANGSCPRKATPRGIKPRRYETSRWLQRPALHREQAAEKRPVTAQRKTEILC